jgi:hypothetical protein
VIARDELRDGRRRLGRLAAVVLGEHVIRACRARRRERLISSAASVTPFFPDCANVAVGPVSAP